MKFYTSDDIKRLIKRFQENEETAQKFFEVELSVLSTLNFHDFFEKLLSNIMDKFSVSLVWVTLIQTSSAVKLIQTYSSSAIPEDHLKIIDRRKFSLVVQNSHKPTLCNENMGLFDILMPKGIDKKFESIAIVPISLDGDTVGSLNFADVSKDRYSPEADTILLEQLGLVVSICLSNVAAHEELKSLAFKDPLTGLLNRRAMERALKRELSRSRRYKSALSVAFIDLDGFKQVNDTFGHDAGDELLVYVADTLKQMSRQSDIVSRFAGDEFVIILPEASTAEAGFLIQRAQSYFAEHPLSLNGARITVRFSCGIAAPDHEAGDDAAALLKKADGLLYKDKQARKAG
ncbi:MAG TPA: sensor domain-containing diguanylate cyclase [Deltaproteobacteria bacterium]|jgi:diguanylate cyclase (GGDEF)-like protein|nr:sensor domain-containing diguanylate cyclase [Deltaproteobacteria bacterium]HQJ09099.1 sensor domain-containing diguanylate cyclase [Deltaproteobacteria bacterium]